MVLPELNWEIFMDKCLIEWTYHEQEMESKKRSTYLKKIFSEVGKSLFPIVFYTGPFSGTE